MEHDAELLFNELADLSPDQREQYFRSRVVSPDLRAEVESLLEYDSGTHPVFADCVERSAAQVVETTAFRTEPPAPGSLFGSYRLVRLLGRGGMSAVYLAERADGEVTQNVAIKLLRYGSDEPAFRDRFLRERQILASLNHHGIARLLDAGHTPDGQPYLVMEYIDGTPIDAAAGRLDLRAKLELFLAACDAVSYAHRNLVIHRDLKPSNILVDAAGRPKLLDFGIAKILEPDQSQTQTGERLMTPEFASPEQIRGGAHSASSDIYSLGAVLYTLLTGRSPHALERGSITDIAWAICHREPATATRLKPDLPKDLDFILAKALRKEPEERYQSVDALAEDVRAFLEWRPVRARSGNTWYRMRKFTRRYRILVAAAALTVAGLSIGLYVANRERALAQRQFLQVRQMASKWIDLDTDVRGLRNSVPARKRILSTSLEYLARIGADAGKDRDLNLEIAAEYLQVARLQGVPEESNLGQFAEAEQSLRKAGALADSVLSRSPHDLAALQLSTRIAYNRLMLASFQDRYADVATHARKVMSQIKQLEAGGTSIGEYQRMYDEAKQQSSQTAVGASEASGINASIRAAAGATGVILNSWGDNQYGQLGIGSFTDSLTPTPSTAPGRLVAIDAGWVHQLALRSDGTVWAWGGTRMANWDSVRTLRAQSPSRSEH